MAVALPECGLLLTLVDDGGDELDIIAMSAALLETRAGVGGGRGSRHAVYSIQMGREIGCHGVRRAAEAVHSQSPAGG